jgi:hypothetical protein
MKLQFKHQKFQADAAKAVVDNKNVTASEVEAQIAAVDTAVDTAKKEAEEVLWSILSGTTESKSNANLTHPRILYPNSPHSRLLVVAGIFLLWHNVSALPRQAEMAETESAMRRGG